ncbi:MAG: cadherin repeat domain-containing protein, partial [Gimesia sp.]|nr:cadherin repeat domain-containing protein [Gimesia sp.]
MLLKDWLSSFRSPFKFRSHRLQKSLRHKKRNPSRLLAALEKLEDRVMLSGTNDAPVFTSGEMGYWWSVPEDTPVGGTVGTVAATDPEGGAVSYQLTTGNSVFSIDSNTGVVTLLSALDYETSQSASFTVQATDPEGTIASSWADITVTDVNEAPVFAVGEMGHWWSLPEDTAVGSVVGTASATDPQGDAVSYELTSGNTTFSIDATTGAITLLTALDYETSQFASFGVRATDTNGNASTSWGDVTVTDVNEAPTFTDGGMGYWWSLPEDTPIGTIVGTVTANDPQSDPVSYQLTAGATTFSIDSNTGEVTLIAALDYETSQNASFSVQASDTNGNSSTTWADIMVEDVAESAGGSTPTIPLPLLVNDTDIPGDNITTDPTIFGQVSYDGDMMMLAVEVDLNGDQISDGYAALDTMTG